MDDLYKNLLKAKKLSKALPVMGEYYMIMHPDVEKQLTDEQKKQLGVISLNELHTNT